MLRSEIRLRMMPSMYFVCDIWCGSVFNSVSSLCCVLKVVRECCEDRYQANYLLYRSVSPGRNLN